jgi:hypothetical protein
LPALPGHHQTPGKTSAGGNVNMNQVQCFIAGMLAMTILAGTFLVAACVIADLKNLAARRRREREIESKFHTLT